MVKHVIKIYLEKEDEDILRKRTKEAGLEKISEYVRYLLHHNLLILDSNARQILEILSSVALTPK